MAGSLGTEYADKLSEEFPTKLLEITMGYQSSQVGCASGKPQIYDASMSTHISLSNIACL